MWPRQNAQAWQVCLFSVALLSAMFFGASARSAISETCAFGDVDAPDELILAVRKLQEGDYLGFVSVIETGEQSPSENSLQLASELEKYAADGFELCTLAKEDIRLNSQSYFLVFKDVTLDEERIVYVFFMLAKMHEEWLFLKTQVSTDFDQVYAFVR